MLEYVVICREDRKPDGTKGRYVLGTRTVFTNEEQAECYAKTIHGSREPIVVPGRWEDLRFGPPTNIDPMDMNYWQKRATEHERVQSGDATAASDTASAAT